MEPLAIGTRSIYTESRSGFNLNTTEPPGNRGLPLGYTENIRDARVLRSGCFPDRSGSNPERRPGPRGCYLRPARRPRGDGTGAILASLQEDT